MILDGIDYGDGYTKATELGPLVEWRSDSGLWVFRTAMYMPLFDGETYRRPMTQAEKDAEAGKVPESVHTELVDSVATLLSQSLTHDDLIALASGDVKKAFLNQATRIIAMVREHDAKQETKPTGGANG